MPSQLVDCRSYLTDPGRGRSEYLAAHVPGAAFLDMAEDLSDTSIAGAGRHPLPGAERFAQVAGRAGIGNDTVVVAYDDGTGVASARLWWLLRHFGHDDAGVLAGGIGAWHGPLQAGEEVIEPRTFVAAEPRQDDTIGAEELLARRDDPGLVVVDARAPERFRGEVEPIDAVAGHIPGAVNWPYAAAAGRPVPSTIAEADEIAVYCGSGVSACVTLLALHLAGRPDARLYPGSWSEWSAAGRPVAVGDA